MIFRKSALVVVVIVFAVVGAGVWVIRNGIIEDILNDEMTQLAGAKSGVRGLDLSIVDLSASFRHLEIGDKNNVMQNVVETGQAKFDLAFMPLLARKAVIEELDLTGLQFHTARKTSAALAEPKAALPAKPEPTGEQSDIKTESAKKATDALDGLRKKLPTLNLETLTKELDIDGLTDPKNLESVKAIKQARTDTLEKVHSVNTQFDNQTVTTNVEKLLAQVNAIDTNIKDLKALKQTAEDLKAIRSNAKSIQTEVSTLKQSTQEGISSIKLSVNNADDLVNQDIQKARNLAKLGSLDVADIAKMVFGQAVLDQFATGMKYFESARKFVKSNGQEEAVKPERRKGRNIDFAVTQPTYPRLLIKTANFSGKGDNTQLDGKLTGLASDPRKYQQPLILKAKYTNQGSSWQIDSTLDHRMNKASDLVSIQGSNVTLGTLSLKTKPESGLPAAITPENTKVSVIFKLDDNILASELRLDSRNVNFDFGDQVLSGKNRQIQESLKSLFKDFGDVNLVAKLNGPLSSPDLHVSSNIDSKISARLNQLVGEKIKETENKIRQKIKQQANAELDSAKQQFAMEQKKLEQKLAAVTQKANQLETSLKEKEDSIKKKLDEQVNDKKDAAQKKAEDKVKGKLKGLKF